MGESNRESATNELSKYGHRPSRSDWGRRAWGLFMLVVGLILAVGNLYGLPDVLGGFPSADTYTGSIIYLVAYLLPGLLGWFLIWRGTRKVFGK